MKRPDGLLGVELRHLAALDAVVREGGFARAAAELGYTQSALSQQIAALERIVGMPLLERRSGRSPVGTTEAGALVLRHAERILNGLRAAEADLTALREGSAGALRIGTFQTVGMGILPPLLRRFEVGHRDVDVTLVEAVSRESLMRRVETGDVDASFAVLPADDGPFEAAHLMADDWVLLVPAGAPLAGRTAPLELDDLQGLTLVAYRYTRPYNAEQRLRTLGVQTRVILRSDETATVHGLVAAGVASAILPRLAVNLLDDRVRLLPIGHLLPPRRIGLIWHRDRRHSTAFADFLALAREVCAELEAA
jgi:DNA-binding transcriptional LysR family regulator